MNRTSDVMRRTHETQVHLQLNLDGTGKADVATGVGFLDHMLELFAKHSAMDLSVAAKGDLHVDPHHTVEDIGICLGMAMDQALGDKSGIRRYGSMTLPMDETLVTAAVDLSGRTYFVFNAQPANVKLGDFDAELIEDFWYAFATHAKCNLHILQHYGRNTHHICEAIFKSTARALRMAAESDPRESGIPSTKGKL